MPVATNFATPDLLIRHFGRHCNDFAVTSEAEYLERARNFANIPIEAGGEIEELQRTRGVVLTDEWVRYNKATNELCVTKTDGTICTYFKPVMMSAAPSGTPRDKMHKSSSNYQYFLDTCKLP